MRAEPQQRTFTCRNTATQTRLTGPHLCFLFLLLTGVDADVLTCLAAALHARHAARCSSASQDHCTQLSNAVCERPQGHHDDHRPSMSPCPTTASSTCCSVTRVRGERRPCRGDSSHAAAAGESATALLPVGPAEAAATASAAVAASNAAAAAVVGAGPGLRSFPTTCRQPTKRTQQ